MLQRDDLKQYTAEAFTSIALLALTAALTNRWSRRRLGALSAFAVIAIFFAPTVMFVAAAVFAGLALEAAVTRHATRLIEVLVAGAVTAALSATVYLLTIRPVTIPSLRAYWNAYYLPRNGQLFGAAWDRLSALAGAAGFSHPIAAVLVTIAGIAALLRLRRIALAVIVPLTIAINVTAGAARAYPFGDLRTSTYWLVMIPVLAGVAVSYAASRVRQWSRPLSVLVATIALIAWIPSVRPSIRSHLIPPENVEAQADYLEAHFRGGDVVVLSESASFAFAFYDREWPPTYKHFSAVATGFLPEYPNLPFLIQLKSRLPGPIMAAVKQAVHLAGSRGRVWIVRSHLSAAESSAWAQALAGMDVKPVLDDSEPLLLYSPS